MEPKLNSKKIINKLFSGSYRDPFSFLGMHRHKEVIYFRVLLPNAQQITVLDRLTAAPVLQLSCIDQRGFFLRLYSRLRC
ncbi:1,4-alpha-glucan branching enzyme GlgB [Moellerella wisconsensis]|nr:1,4-alpha-glucan branching enzyme GlgB [Moellerella wisconsensis]